MEVVYQIGEGDYGNVLQRDEGGAGVIKVGDVVEINLRMRVTRVTSELAGDLPYTALSGQTLDAEGKEISFGYTIVPGETVTEVIKHN